MSASTLSEQLVKYLTDVHAMEVQALAQMRAAPKLAGDEGLARAYDAHRIETEQHEALVRGRLEAHGASPSRVEDLLGAVSGKGFVLFARSQPDTPGKLATHAFSYEHMELAAYDLLARVAERVGDQETVDVARRIREEENAMAIRLDGFWDQTVDASLEGKDPAEALDDYLADAHALEAQGIELLKRAPTRAGRRGRQSPGRVPAPHRADRAPAQGPRRITEPAQGRRPAPGRDQLERVLRRPAGHPGQAGDVRSTRSSTSRSAPTSSSRGSRGAPGTARPRWWPTRSCPTSAPRPSTSTAASMRRWTPHSTRR